MTAYNQSYKQLEIKVNTKRGDITKKFSAFIAKNSLRFIIICDNDIYIAQNR